MPSRSSRTLHPEFVSYPLRRELTVTVSVREYKALKRLEDYRGYRAPLLLNDLALRSSVARAVIAAWEK